jgi:hypothetical protein
VGRFDEAADAVVEQQQVPDVDRRCVLRVAHVQIEITVSVDVTGGEPHAVDGRSHAGAVRYVEQDTLVVAEQSKRFGRHLEHAVADIAPRAQTITAAAREVEPPVAVEVAKRQHIPGRRRRGLARSPGRRGHVLEGATRSQLDGAAARRGRRRIERRIGRGVWDARIRVRRARAQRQRESAPAAVLRRRAAEVLPGRGPRLGL